MNFNHVHVDCYVSFNDIRWLLIKVTGQETVSTKPLSNFGSNGSYSVKLWGLCCDYFACDLFFLQRQLCVVIVDASVLYLIKYFTLFAEDLDLMEIVIEDSEVFYLFLLAKK